MLSDIKNKIKGLNPNKATTHNNIPPKILRKSAEVTANTLQLVFDNAISNSEFPENLKLADVTSVFKRKVPLGHSYLILRLTILTAKNLCFTEFCTKFIEIQGWLLLTFLTCLHNQLSFFSSIIVQISEKRDLSNRQ